MLKLVEKKPAHSHIGASSMYRWKKCPGSVKLSEGIESPTSIHALRGSAAHEIIALAMEEAFADNRPTTEVLQDYWDAITVYSDYVEGIKKKYPGCAVHVEHKFDMSSIFPDMYGTADCVIWIPEIRLLIIIDYKHGKGIPVDVIENLQLSYYGLGAIETLKYMPFEVELTIVQPRCYHPGGLIRSWRVPNIYFIDFKADLIAAAKETLKKKARIQPGDHCMFCPAKLKCTVANKNYKGKKNRSINFYRDPKKDFQVIA